MNAQRLKEYRQILPAWGLALLLATSPFLVKLSGVHTLRPHLQSLWELASGLGGIAVAFSVLYLTLSSFGSEFSNQTFLLMLTQPVSRACLWREKLVSLGVATGTVGLVFWLSIWGSADWFPNSARVLHWSPVLLAVAFGGGLWTSLLFRQFVPALVFAVLIPAMLFATSSAFGERFFPASREAIVMGVLLSYAALGVFAARRIWLRAQDFNWLAADLSFNPKARATGESQRRIEGTRFSAPTALWRKELHLQMPAVICAVVYVVVCALVIGLTQLVGSGRIGEGFYEPAIFMCILLMPLLTGGLAFAEERRLGTMQSFCGLPVSRARQFLTKVVSAYAMGLLLGGALPWCLKILVTQFAGTTVFAAGNDSAFSFVIILAPLAITTLALYASSLTSSTLAALGVTLGLGAGGTLIATVLLSNNAESRYGPGLLWELVSWTVWKLFGRAGVHEFSYLSSFHDSPLLWQIARYAIPLLVLGLTYTNYTSRRGPCRLWLRNLRTAVIYVVVVYVLTAATFLRVWEFAMPRNPTLGPARMGETKNLKLVGAGTMAAALLPDGRVWMCAFAFSEPAPPDYWPQQLETATSRFIRGSNWTDLAASGSEVVGLRSDGSLWRLQQGSLEPSRLGNDQDWRIISGGNEYFLALKQNGSLWSWPSPNVALHAPGPNPRASPIRVGSDTNWVGVHVAGALRIAVRADGTVWRWGIFFEPDATASWKMKTIEHPEPWLKIPWNDFKVRQAWLNSICIERADGTFWINHNGDAEQWSEFDAIKHWRAWRFQDSAVLGIAADGTIRIMPVPASNPGVDDSYALSKPNSWLAATRCGNCIVALGQDGTLWQWGKVVWSPRRDLLQPSRNPWLLARMFE